MNRTSPRRTILLAIVFGFLGGILSDRCLDSRPAWAQAPQEPATILRAEGFVLVDKAGNPRGRLGLSQGGVPQLELFSEGGDSLASIIAYPQGGFVSLKSPARNSQIILNASPSVPRILVSEDHRALAAIDVMEKGQPSFQMFDKNQKARVSIGLDHGNATLALMDPAGATRSLISVGPDGTSALSLNNRDQQSLASFEVKANGRPSLTLRGKDGKTGASLEVLPNGKGALRLSE